MKKDPKKELPKYNTNVLFKTDRSIWIGTFYDANVFVGFSAMFNESDFKPEDVHWWIDLKDIDKI